MNKGSGGRRSRRGNGKRNSKNSNFDSNGPDVRVRGNAQQVLDRYLTLARDATSAGDRIASENYYQHAEHYYRILHANGGDARRGNGRQLPSQPADRPPEPEAEELVEGARGESNGTSEWERTGHTNTEAATKATTEATDPAATEAVETTENDSPDSPSSETAIA